MATHIKSAISNPSRKPFRSPPRLLVAAVTGCFAVGAIAQSSGFTVVNGTAVASKVGAVTTITNSNGAILNWNQFNIAAGDTTHFLQPSVSSAVLNRVLGSDPSQIYGTLSSNGRVWLINPAGIMVGASGRVDTAGFVASTLGVSNSDFLAGRLNFGMDGGNAAGVGAVVNQGAITTSAGGSVYLVASNVTNEGIITTPQGETILAAGQTVQLIDTATPGVKVEITGAEGNATNLGTIVSDAGRIGIAGVIAKNSGTLNASSVVSEGGRVFLKASQDAYVDGAGRIVTTGTKGGSVEVLGSRVAVMDNASIVASGTNGGGTIKIGGDYQGKNPDVQNAVVAYFGPNASLNVDADSVGAGGTLIVWADDTTRALGSISARGGAGGGDGGFVETSGKRYLAVDGIRVDTRARGAGDTGTWLLDPSDISIVSGGSSNASTKAVESDPRGGVLTTEFSTGYGGVSVISDATINSQLLTTDVVIHTAGGTGGNGNIVINGANIVGGTNAHALTLAADASGNPAGGNITVISSVLDVDDGVTMLAGWNGVIPPYGSDGNTFSSTDVINGRGNINLSGATLKSASHGVYLWAGKDVNLLANSVIQASMTEILAGNDVITNGGRIGGVTSALVAIDIGAGRDISITGSAFETFGGVMNFTAGRDFKLSANTNGGSILSTAGCSTPADVGCRENPSTFAFAQGGLQSVSAVGRVIVEAHPGGGAGVALFSGGGQDITADSVEIRGGLVGNGNDAWITNRSASGQTISARTILLQGGGTGSNDQNNDAGIFSTGLQTINVTGTGGALTMNGGSATGTARQNAAYLGTSGGAGQVINVAGGGSITLQGGGGTGSFENWAMISSSSTQIINIHDGGSITLRGGAGSGNNNSVTPADGTSNNYAKINSAGAQSISYYGSATGRLDLYGGTVGNSNYARISQTGSAHQSITGNPIITLTGGDSGGLGGTDEFWSGSFAPARGNTAIIASGKAFDVEGDDINAPGFGIPDPGTWVQGTQSIDAAEITLKGTSLTGVATGRSAAGLFSAYGQTINVQGTISLLVGDSSTRSRTRIWSMGGDQEINANKLRLVGAPTGNVVDNFATIGSWGEQFITLGADGSEGPALLLQTNNSGATNVLNNSFTGSQTVTFTGHEAQLRVVGPTAALGTNFVNATSNGNQLIEFENGGSIVLQGVGRASSFGAQIISSGTQDIVGATSVTLIGANESNGLAVIVAKGAQHIETNTLNITGGGGTAFNSSASIEHGVLDDTGGLLVSGSQAIVLTGSNASLTLRGGSGSGNNNTVTPADGTSNNYAAINSAGAQTIAFVGSGTGRLDMYGGSVGNSNYARISQTGSAHQSITGNPIITLTGGDSGGLGFSPAITDDLLSGAFAPPRGNTAIIASGKAFDTDTDENSAGFGQVDPVTWVQGTQSIDAAEITINGSSRTVTATGMGGAGLFSAYGQTVNVVGDLKLLGGNATNTILSTARSRTRLWSMGGEQVINANQLHIIGAATGTNNIATIGSWGNQTINLSAAGTEGPALWLQTNGSGATNLLNNSLSGNQTITFTGNNAILKVEGPFSSLGTNFNPLNTARPNQSIVFNSGGSIEVIGVGRPLNALDGFQDPRANIVSSGDQEIIGATSITITGGSTANGRAAVLAQGDQYIETNQLTLTGGGGTASNSFAIIQHGVNLDNGSLSVWGNQTIELIDANASLTLQGGSGSGRDSRTDQYGAAINPNWSGNYAQIVSRGGNQSIDFSHSDGSLSVLGGSVGTANFAEIKASHGQTISGDPNVLVRGGASGGAARIADNVSTQDGHERSNHAYISGGDDENGGPTNSFMSFNSLTMEGGGDASSYSGAGIEGFNLALHVAQDVNMTGGASNAIDVGDEVPNATSAAHIGADGQLTLNVGGHLTIAAGTGSSGLAFVGSGGPAAINLNVGGDLELSAKENAASSAGVGSLFGQATGSILVGGSADLLAQYGGKVVIGSHLGPMLGIPYPADLTSPSVLPPLLNGGDVAITNGLTIGASDSGAILTVGASRNIKLIGANIAGNSSYGLAVNLYAGSSVNDELLIANSVVETFGQDMHLSASNITLTADASRGSAVSTAGCAVFAQPGNCGSANRGTFVHTGHQVVEATGLLKLQANDAGGNGIALISGGGQEVFAHRIELTAGLTGEKNGAFLTNYADQTYNGQVVSANQIVMKAGGSGANDYGNRAVIASFGASQEINVDGANGVLSLQGGAGFGIDTSFQIGKLVTTPADPVNSVPEVATPLYGSNNTAQIYSEGGSQAIHFGATGGSITMTGGTRGPVGTATGQYGTANNALIWNDAASAQTITGRPTINLIGGASGGDAGSAFNSYQKFTLLGVSMERNAAMIASGRGDFSCVPSPCAIINLVAGTQDISAQQITIMGTGLLGDDSRTGRSSAVVNAGGGQTINVVGELSLLGGDKTDVRGQSSAQLRTYSGVQTITAERMSLTGTTTTSSRPNDATVTGYGTHQNITLTKSNGNALSMNTNAATSVGVSAGTSSGSPLEIHQTITFTGANAGATMDGAAAIGLFASNPNGLQSIVFQYGGSLSMTGGAMRANVSPLLWSFSNQSILGATSISLVGGNQAFSGGQQNLGGASILSFGDQRLETSSLSLTGGSGATAFANSVQIGHSGLPESPTQPSWGDQTIVMTGANATLTLAGGSGAGANPNASGNSGNYARIKSGHGLQSIQFSQTGGSLSITGGSIGTENMAAINSDFGQTITGNPVVVIQGGSSGGAATVGIVNGVRERGNDAGIFGGDKEDGGSEVSTLNFASLTIQGGTADFGNAGVGGDIVNLHVQGNVTLNGGSSNQGDPLSDLIDGSSIAFIGHDEGGHLNLDIGGNLTMTSGTGTSGPVIIGSIEGASANVHVVGNVTVTAGVARAVIGSAASSTEYGGNTSVSVVSGGDVTITAGTVATGSVVIGSTNNKIVFDGCADGCEDLGTGPVNVELIAARDITLSGQTGGVVIGTKDRGVVADPSLYSYPPSDPSSHVVLAAGAEYPDIVTFGVGGGIGASGYGGNINTVGSVSIKTDQFSSASITLDAFESLGGGGGGDMSLAQGSIIDGDRVIVSAGGNLDLGATLTGTDDVDLAAGWNYSLEDGSLRGGNLNLATVSSLSSLGSTEIWAAHGPNQASGNITLNGTINGGHGVGVWAARDVRVNGSVSSGRSGWDAVWIESGDSGDSAIGGSVYFGSASTVSALSDGGVQVRSSGPGNGTGDIVQSAGSTLTADDDIKMVASGNLVINGDLTSNNDEIILYTETNGIGATDGKIHIGLGSELRSERAQVRAAGDLIISGLVDATNGYIQLSAGYDGEGETPRGGDILFQPTSVVRAFAEVTIAALAGAATGNGGNVSLAGSITSSDYDDGAVSVLADRDIVVSVTINNGAGDYYRGVQLVAGANGSSYGGDVTFTSGSQLDANLSSVRVSAFGGTETAGNINHSGVMWGNYAKLDADGDITIDGSVGGRYYTEFNAGLNRNAGRGGDVVFGPTSVVNPNMTVASPNGGVGIVARGGTESHGSVSQNGGVIDGGLEGINISADSNVNLSGNLHSTNEVSVTAGHKHYNDQDQLVGTGGDISFGSASQLDAKYFSFNALGGAVAQGHIVQSGGTISSLHNTYLGADGNVTLNGHLQASAIEIDAAGNVMQGSSGLLAGGHNVLVRAGGNVDLLGNLTVADGGEGFVGVFAGHVRDYYDETNVYHPGGEQLVRDKHITINSINGVGSVPTNDVTLNATGPIRATVQHVGHVNASIANAAYGGITITLNGASEPVLHLADEADSQNAITVNRTSGDFLVTDGSVFDAGGGHVALAALSGNVTWAALHAYGGSLSLAAGGTITQSTPINFASLTTSSGGATTLTAANAVDAYSGSAGGTGSLEFDSVHSLIVGNVTGSQLVALSSGGALSQTGTITAGSLFTESASGTALTGNNSVISYSGYNSDSGNIAFTNAKPGNLVLADLMQRQFAVQNDAETGMVTISTAGSLSQSSTVNAASLMTTTLGGAQLGLNNQVFTYSGQNTGNGAIEFRSDDAEGLVVGAVSNSATSGAVRLASAGTMTLSGQITSTANIVLNSAGAIVAPGNLTGLTLNSTSVGGADFSGDNQIGTIAALNNSGSGVIELNNIANTLNIAQINNTAGGVGIDNDGAITVSGPVTASGLVGLAAFGVGGDISQTGGAITSGGDLILLADRNVSLNGQTSAVGGANVLAGLNVAATAGGNIALGATSQVSARDIFLIADRDTGTGVFTTGNVTQQAGSSLQSSNDFLVNASGNINMLGAVTGGAAGRTNLLAGFNNSTGSEQAYTGAQVTASNLQANGGSVSIQATGAVNALVQSAGAVAVNINNSAAGGLNLTSYGASSLVLVDNSVANSAVTLNYQNGPLTLGANSALVTANGTGNVSVSANGGNLVYSGANVSASEVRLNSTGAISQTAPLTTNVLYTVSAGGTALTMDNVVGTYSGVNTSSGNLAFKTVKTGGLVLAGTTSTAVQNSAATGDINITSAGTGALTINGMVTGLRNVALNSAGAINATAKLTGVGLNSVSIGGANYAGPNQFATIADLTNTGTGNVVFKNTASPLTISKVSNAVGDVTVDNNGAVIINGPMTASGTLSVTALSPVTVTSTGSVRSGGNLNLTASSSSAASTIDLLTIGGEVTSSAGNIGLFGGSGIVVTSNVVATNGDVNAESPFGSITQDPKDSIRAPNGKVTLNAFVSRAEDPIVIPPETIPDTTTSDKPAEIVVVAALSTSTPVSPSNVANDTTGGTSGTFGATEEKKDEKKEEEKKKATAGADASAEEKPAAQKAVGSCT
jgi:filamentous hemagglutinin family protein